MTRAGGIRVTTGIRTSARRTSTGWPPRVSVSTMATSPRRNAFLRARASYSDATSSASDWSARWTRNITKSITSRPASRRCPGNYKRPATARASWASGTWANRWTASPSSAASSGVRISAAVWVSNTRRAGTKSCFATSAMRAFPSASTNTLSRSSRAKRWSSSARRTIGLSSSICLTIRPTGRWMCRSAMRNNTNTSKTRTAARPAR